MPLPQFILDEMFGDKNQNKKIKLFVKGKQVKIETNEKPNGHGMKPIVNVELKEEVAE